MLVMAETDREEVVLYAKVREDTRIRLRLAAVKRGITMGELLDEIINKALPPVDHEGDRSD